MIEPFAATFHTNLYFWYGIDTCDGEREPISSGEIFNEPQVPVSRMFVTNRSALWALET